MKPAKNKNQRKKKHPTIRVGDTVQVISGKDKGQIGKVLKIDWKNERILVDGVNKVYHHQKPNQQNQQGSINVTEAPIHYSNVLLYSPTVKRGVRVRVERTGKVKKRICVKSSNIIE